MPDGQVLPDRSSPSVVFPLSLHDACLAWPPARPAETFGLWQQMATNGRVGTDETKRGLAGWEDLVAGNESQAAQKDRVWFPGGGALNDQRFDQG